MKTKWTSLIFRRALVAGLVLSPWSGQSLAEEAKLKTVTVVLNYPVVASHAAFVYGIDHGIYAKEGIDLKLMESPSSIDANKKIVEDKSVRYAYGDAAAMIKVSQQSSASLVMVSNLVQVFANGLVTFEDQGVKSIPALAGKQISFGPTDSSRESWPAVLKALKLDRKEFKELILNGAAKQNALVNNSAAAMGGLITFHGGALEAAANGRKERWLLFSDAGVSIITQGLSMRKEDLADVDLNKRMMRATRLAWEKAGADPDAAVESLFKLYPATKVTKSVAKFQWAETFKRLHSKRTVGKTPGFMDPKDWDVLLDYERTYVELKDLKPATEYYTNDFNH